MTDDRTPIDPEVLKEDMQYVRGFNLGYTISEFMPMLVNALDRVDSHDPLFQGFKDGSKQLELDKVIDALRETPWTEREVSDDFNQVKDNEKGKGQEHTRDKDDHEPEL